MLRNRRATILVADDHLLVAEGCRRALEQHFEFLGVVSDGAALLQTAAEAKPDVILLDISMPLMNGIEAARQLHKTLPRTKLVFVTVHSEKAYVVEALRAGASGYVLKSCAGSELVQAVREVLQGRLFVAPAPLREALPELQREARGRKGSWDSLTARQREVLRLIAEGKSAKEIADILCVSIKTVEFHKANIKKTLSLRSVAELARWAAQKGMI